MVAAVRRVGMALRVGLGVALFALSISTALSQEHDVASIARTKARLLLAGVERWGCQYQNVDLDRIAGSDLDLIVIDPVLDGGTGRNIDHQHIKTLQRKPDGSRRLVFAYLSIGAAEEYRAYWQADWQNKPPTWLGASSPDWPRSHAVQFWQPDWQRIAAEGLQRIVAAGFDGVFLDRVDAYQDWKELRPSALEDMADLVIQLSQSARKSAPGFLVIGQNAEHLLAEPRYREVIDAVSKESLLTGLQGQGVSNSMDQISWSMPYLLMAQESGLTVLVIEYLDDSPENDAVRQRHRIMRFRPFLAKRLLDRLP